MKVLMIIGVIIVLLSLASLVLGVLITQIIIKRNLEKRGLFYSGTSLIAFQRSLNTYREIAQKRENKSLLVPLNRFNKLLIIVPFSFILGLLVMVIGKSLE